MVLNGRVLSLVQEHIDMGLPIRALPDSSLIELRGDATRRMVCASPASLAARGTARTPDDLAVHDCISYVGFASPDICTFVRDNLSVVVPTRTRLGVGCAEAASDAACAGIGTTSAFSDHFKAALDRGALTTLLNEFQPATLPVNLVYTANRFLPIKERAFLDFAPPRLKPILAE